MAVSDADDHRWLPPFCSLPTLFALMLVAELVALIVVLAPGADGAPLMRLGIVSVYVQWLALLNAVVLCSLRGALDRLTPRSGLLIAWLVMIGVTTLAALLIQTMDRALGLGLTGSGGAAARFVPANAVLCALIGAALLRYLFVIEQWRERVRAASKAQVDALQARIRPHFLFNSMNTIASLIRTRPADAERAVEDLSDLFRAALGANDASGTLGEELERVDHYLRIESLRLGPRLAIRRDLDTLPRDFALPPLLLQPLVENAIYHGIEPLPDGGTLALTGRRLVDGWEIAIDNPCPERPARRGGNGHAIDNIRARIGYHFGDRAALIAEPGAGCFRVIVRLPLEPPDGHPPAMSARAR